MKKLPQLAREKLVLLVAAPVIVACLEVLWNLPLGRFPIYWLPVYSPVPALIINISIHIILTIFAVFIVGVVFIMIVRKRWGTGCFLLIAGVLYAFYMGATAL